MQMYQSLAKWWPLLAPVEAYEPESLVYSSLIKNNISDWGSVLELGCGGGYLLSHFPKHIEKVLVDESEEMLTLSREVNPGATHLRADMRQLDLGRTFDVVLIQDAIMYMNTRTDVEAVLRTAAVHCREGGVILLVPDVTTESFFEGNTLLAGSDGETSAVRLMEWHWDPDPSDERYTVEFSFLLRENGVVESHHESHVMGLFSLGDWQTMLEAAGFQLLEVEIPPGVETGHVFLARKLGDLMPKS